MGVGGSAVAAAAVDLADNDVGTDGRWNGGGGVGENGRLPHQQQQECQWCGQVPRKQR